MNVEGEVLTLGSPASGLSGLGYKKSFIGPRLEVTQQREQLLCVYPDLPLQKLRIIASDKVLSPRFNS